MNTLLGERDAYHDWFWDCIGESVFSHDDLQTRKNTSPANQSGKFPAGYAFCFPCNLADTSDGSGRMRTASKHQGNQAKGERWYLGTSAIQCVQLFNIHIDTFSLHAATPPRPTRSSSEAHM